MCNIPEKFWPYVDNIFSKVHGACLQNIEYEYGNPKRISLDLTDWEIILEWTPDGIIAHIDGMPPDD